MNQGDKQILVVAQNAASCSFAFWIFLHLIFGFIPQK